MYLLQLDWFGTWVTLGEYKTREDAHWQAARWREKYGRPTHEVDPFQVVEVPKIEETYR